MSWWRSIVGIGLGQALSGLSGLRAMLPAFLLAVLHLALPDIVPLAKGYEWVSSWPSVLTLGIMVVVEFVVDKFPGIDHIVHTIEGPLHTIIGGVIVLFPDGLDSFWTRIPFLIMGLFNALMMFLARYVLRAMSSASSCGVCNPCLSFTEDLIVTGGGLFSILLAWGAIILGIIVICVTVWYFIKRGYRQLKQKFVEGKSITLEEDKKDQEEKAEAYEEIQQFQNPI